MFSLFIHFYYERFNVSYFNALKYRYLTYMKKKKY